MDIFKPLNHAEAHVFVKNYMKIYQKKAKLYVYHEPYEKRIAGLESTETQLRGHKNLKSPIAELLAKNENLKRSIRRTRTVITDLIEMNKFTMLGTLTMSPEQVDRYDDDLVKEKLSKWLQNQKRNTDFQYLIIPEKHKDGALHFHGLFKNFPTSKLVDSGKKDRARRPIYNVKSYSLGWSNFSYIGSLEATAIYCKKYITKDIDDTDAGKRRYWHSKDLLMPKIDMNVDVETVLSSGQVETWERKNHVAYEITPFP